MIHCAEITFLASVVSFFGGVALMAWIEAMS